MSSKEEKPESGEQQLPDVITQEQAQAIADQALENMLSFASNYVPHVPREVIAQLVLSELEYVQECHQVIADTIDPESRAKYPLWGFTIHQVSPDGSRRVVTKGLFPKSLPMGEDVPLPLLMGIASMLGLLHSSEYRAVLRAYGLEVRFNQTADRPKSPIYTGSDN